MRKGGGVVNVECGRVGGEGFTIVACQKTISGGRMRNCYDLPEIWKLDIIVGAAKQLP